MSGNWISRKKLGDGDPETVRLVTGLWYIDNVAVTATAAALNGAVAGVAVRKNSTGSTYTRPQLNLIEGGNVALTVADDSGTGEVDVTASVPVTSLLKWGTD
jgi:hypothetical protein